MMSTTPNPVSPQHSIISTNPSRNYEVLGDVEMSSPEEVQAKVRAAKDAFPTWSALTVKERLVYAQNLRDLYVENREKIATLQTQEMGMPITQGYLNTDRAIAYMDWSLENAEKSLSPSVTFETDTEINHVHHVPYGVVAAISPWNVPANNVIWAVFQSLIAGNTVVFKNS
ncbi:MAG: aldehyde dehydrogenase, partial [Alphaproteobacteria bacterium]|nr:aldehyde dehydrogenase [Alphaproteobacteria bacterium]